MENAFGGLGSLAQSARKKELKSARWILIVIGILTIVVNVGFVASARSIVDKEIDAELQSIRLQGMVVDEAEVERVRESSLRSVVVANGIAIGIGVLYILFGILVYRWPAPITIASLVIYIGSAAAYGVIDPTTLSRGWIVKIFIVAGLFKAVQAAIASEKEKDDAALGPLASPQFG